MIIESNQNPRFKKWSKLKQKKYREKQQEFIVEGEHLVLEALAANAVKEILIRENSHYQLPTHLPTFTLGEHLFKQIATTQTPQPVMAICKITPQIINQKKRLLLLNRIGDPGNLGTLIRSAAAFGFDGVVLDEGCVDLYNEKVVRATGGAIFKIPVVKQALPQYVSELKLEGVTVLGTRLEHGQSLKNVGNLAKMAVILGNEGSGIDEDLLMKVDQCVFIKMNAEIDSLNVAIAGSIIMHELGLYG